MIDWHDRIYLWCAFVVDKKNTKKGQRGNGPRLDNFTLLGQNTEHAIPPSAFFILDRFDGDVTANGLFAARRVTHSNYQIQSLPTLAGKKTLGEEMKEKKEAFRPALVGRRGCSGEHQRRHKSRFRSGGRCCRPGRPFSGVPHPCRSWASRLQKCAREPSVWYVPLSRHY